ncbi:MAG: Holliday junction resolvase RuvX [Puniceicoccales bacterium]|jgi:putative Holliday junction resolvase|nr:Holliday junction resolvase RuvX [Puniceicoccales bacterium]
MRSNTPVRNFLGIDHGDRRIGLSHGDSETTLAFPLPPAIEPTPEERLAHINAEIRRLHINELVVGYPLLPDGTAGARTQVVDAFIATLETQFKLPVHRSDETLTSVEASKTLSPHQRGRTPAERRRHRATGILDSRAATLILQDFLETHFPPPIP